MRRPFLASVMILLASAASGAEICVTDSIRPAEGASPKQRAFLHDACWKPAAFTMAVKETKNPAPYQADALITFPSPKPGGTPQRDLVTAHWYKARDAGGNLIPAGAPCVVVVHSLHPDMADGLILSRMLARNGVHALMVELPGFGSRKTEPDKGAGVEMTEHGAQSVADVRRARDAACALPGVKKGAPVAIEGLSLGSMVASAAAGLDNAFSPVVLVVGGGDPVTVLEKAASTPPGCATAWPSPATPGPNSAPCWTPSTPCWWPAASIRTTAGCTAPPPTASFPKNAATAWRKPSACRRRMSPPSQATTTPP